MHQRPIFVHNAPFVYRTRARGETRDGLHLDTEYARALLLTAFCMRHENHHRRSAAAAKWRKSPGKRAGHCAGAAERDPGVR